VTPVVSMIGVGLALWACIGFAGGAAVSPEAGYALAGPLAAAVGSWLITARVHAADPAKVTSAMVAGFGVKALLFGAYVVVAVRGLGLRPLPFALSFVGFFVVLYAVEAYFLWQLFAGARRPAPE
jgi:hypothetical protein